MERGALFKGKGDKKKGKGKMFSLCRIGGEKNQQQKAKPFSSKTVSIHIKGH